SGVGFNCNIVNLAGALFDAENDQIMTNGNASGTAFFNNAGTFLKSAGTNTTVGVTFNNTGLVDIQSGAMSFNGSLTGSNGSVFEGTGTNLLGGSGTFNLGGSVTISNLLLAIANWTGTTGIINGSFGWTAGQVAPGGKLALTTNSVLNIVGTNSLNSSGTLTNGGTINWMGTGNLSLSFNT